MGSPCKLRFVNILNLLLILLTTIALFCGDKETEAQREFDLFKLSLQWPGTACRATRHHCCSSNACCDRSESLTEFTIHGLWPDYSDGTWPACCSGKRFDVKEISTLMGSLNKYWPSLSCDSPSDCHGGKGLFWEHEWEKHGTCSYPVVQDEYDYFAKALNLYFKYNVTQVLREAGYVGSNSERYPLGGVISAIQNAFHTTPELECTGDAVEELRLCFHKDLQPRDCEIGSSSSCPRYVTLPENFSSSKSIGMYDIQRSVIGESSVELSTSTTLHNNSTRIDRVGEYLLLKRITCSKTICRN